MALIAIVDNDERPIAFILGPYKIQIWHHMESASMEELSEALSVAESAREVDHDSNKS